VISKTQSQMQQAPQKRPSPNIQSSKIMLNNPHASDSEEEEEKSTYVPSQRVSNNSNANKLGSLRNPHAEESDEEFSQSNKNVQPVIKSQPQVQPLVKKFRPVSTRGVSQQE